MKSTVTLTENALYADYERERASLAATGELLDEWTLSENCFSAFRLGDNTVHLGYFPGRGEIRRVTTDAAEPPLPAESPLAERVSDSLICQIDLDNRRIDCGMSYVFRMGDGRFFLIDGGYFTYRECDRLWQLLRTLQPEGEIVIAGWFFSHAHQDHFGCFIEFVSKYVREGLPCRIEGLYYTFPSLSLPEAVFWKQSDNATMREFAYTIDRLLPTIPRYSLHTGQRFSMADLSFEVLFTHEDIYPERISSFNNTSTVLRVTAAGQTILFLGDLQDASCQKLCAMYQDFLKSDLVQVAHHGFNGSTVETYDLVSPAVALWPTADYGFEGNRTRKVNAHLLAMDSVKEHIVAGIDGTRILPLPYAPGASRPVDLLKD